MLKTRFPNAFFAKLTVLVSSIVMSGVAVGFENCVSAQIVLDSTLGSESSVVTPNGSINGSPSDKIDGGAIRGTNLFHSFQEFNVSEGRGIYFSNPDGIENILSRVTGTNTSNIWGKLGVLGNANLFLINPNGIIFGQNASLDVKGSFVASTASSFKFNDQTEFSATASQTTPLLTVSVPSGLQYGANTGRILVQGNGQGTRANGEPIDTTVGLRVQPNKTLALVGGDITLEGGTLKTAGGRIELGSVGSSSLVNLSSNPKGFSLSYESVPAFGKIQLFQQATVDASGIEGGNIQVQGRRVLLSDGSQIESSTLGKGQGGTLRIKASDSVELIGESADALYSTSLATQVYEEATGSGGNLTIETGQLTVQDGAQVLANTYGDGSAGSLRVLARNSVELSGTSADGMAPSSLFTSVGRGATGEGGKLTIETARLAVWNGAQIFAGTAGKGAGGSLAVKAKNVELVGMSTTSRLGSSLATSVEPGGTGTGGNLMIETEQLIVRDGAVVSAATFGSGQGGSVVIRARDLVELAGTSADGLYPSSLSARTRGIANAGSLSVKTQQLTVRDKANVTVRSAGTEDAGNIQIQAHSIRLEDEGRLTATSDSGKGGGNIKLENLSLLLMRSNSEISTNAGGEGNGGNIDINTDLLVGLDNSDITANAVKGRGGNIRINTQGIFGIEPRSKRTPESDITASSELGVDGLVEINRPEVDPSAELAILLSEVVDVSGLVAQGCPANAGPRASKFVITGRGGLPEDPGNPRNGDYSWADLRFFPVESQPNSPPVTTQPTDSAAKPLVEASGWTITSKGEVVLTAAAPSTAIEVPWMTPSSCHAS